MWFLDGILAIGVSFGFTLCCTFVFAESAIFLSIIYVCVCIRRNALCERRHVLLGVGRARACPFVCLCGLVCIYCSFVCFGIMFYWIRGTAHTIGRAVVYEPVHPTLCSQSGSCRKVCQ